MRLGPSIVLSLLILGCATPTPDAISAARAASKANLSTAEGKRYDELLAERAAPSVDAVVQACIAKTPASKLPDVLLLYRINQEGDPVEELLHPESAFGICIRDGIRGFTLTPPPFPDYWVEIDLEFRERVIRH